MNDLKGKGTTWVQIFVMISLIGAISPVIVNAEEIFFESEIHTEPIVGDQDLEEVDVSKPPEEVKNNVTAFATVDGSRESFETL